MEVDIDQDRYQQHGDENNSTLTAEQLEPSEAPVPVVPAVVMVDAAETGDESEPQMKKIRLREHPVHSMFEFNATTNKSACKVCKLDLAGKKPQCSR